MRIRSGQKLVDGSVTSTADKRDSYPSTRMSGLSSETVVPKCPAVTRIVVTTACPKFHYSRQEPAIAVVGFALDAG